MLLAGEVVERAVGDHVDALGVGAEALHQLAAAVRGVGRSTASERAATSRAACSRSRPAPRRSTLWEVNTRGAPVASRKRVERLER